MSALSSMIGRHRLLASTLIGIVLASTSLFEGAALAGLNEQPAIFTEELRATGRCVRPGTVILPRLTLAARRSRMFHQQEGVDR